MKYITLLLFGLTLFSLYPTSYLYTPRRSSGSIFSCNKTKECPLCMEVKLKDDEKRFVLHRSDALMIQFNPRPYAGGHVLIYPTKHVASPHDLDCITWADMFLVADYVMEVLKIVLKVDSFSLGMNIGPNGNGTIPDHLHLHIVPRKSRGGFLETCCNTVLIQEDYGKLYKNMKEYFTKE